MTKLIPRALSVLILSVFVLNAACSKGQKEKNTFEFLINGNKTVIALDEIKENVFDIKAESVIDGETIVSRWRLDYPVYRFDCADINGDGIPEIAAGVVKSTRFDENSAKRLFVFKLYEGIYVRPLWLGSKMPLPLEDFKLKNGHIRTVERESGDTFVVAEYELKTAFSPQFVRYIKKGAGRKEAQALLLKD